MYASVIWVTVVSDNALLAVNIDGLDTTSKSYDVMAVIPSTVFFPDHYQQYKMGRASTAVVIVTISRDIVNVLVLHAITLCMLWKLYTCNNYPGMCRKQLRCYILVWWRHEMKTPFASLAICERSRSIIDFCTNDQKYEALVVSLLLVLVRLW